MDFTQSFTFTHMNSFSKEKDDYIDEASLTMLFEKNIAFCKVLIATCRKTGKT